MRKAQSFSFWDQGELGKTLHLVHLSSDCAGLLERLNSGLLVASALWPPAREGFWAKMGCFQRARGSSEGPGACIVGFTRSKGVENNSDLRFPGLFSGLNRSKEIPELGQGFSV